MKSEKGRPSRRRREGERAVHEAYRIAPLLNYVQYISGQLSWWLLDELFAGVVVGGSTGLSGYVRAEEAGKIARQAKAKTLVVKHLYPVCDDYDMRSLITREFDGNIIISEDAMELQLSKGITTVLS